MEIIKSSIRSCATMLLAIIMLVTLVACTESKGASTNTGASATKTEAEPTKAAEPTVAETVAVADPTEAPTPTETPTPTEAEPDETIDGIDFSKYIRSKETKKEMMSRMNYDSERIVVTDYPAEGGFADFKDGGYAILKDGDIYQIKNKDHTFRFDIYTPKQVERAFLGDEYLIYNQDSDDNINIDSEYDLHYDGGTIDVHVKIIYEDDSTKEITFTITDE